MASDVTKIVKFALKLTGITPAKLTPLVTGFETLRNKVIETQNTITNFQGAIHKLKVPKSFATFSSNLDTLSKVKIKDLNPLAESLTKISQISKMPPIGTFVNNIVTLSGTSLAGLGTLAKNLQAIAKINVEDTVSKLRNLNTALRALEKQGGLTTFARFATDVRAMRSALDNSQASINRMTDSLHQIGNTAQSSGLKLRSLGDKFRTVLTFRLISEGIIQAKLAITQGIAAIIDYDQALKDLQAITGATSTEIAQMGKKILEVADTTKFSASEVATGMRTLGQAGFTASEAVLTMQGVSDLATGTLSEMSQVVDLVTTAMRVFQIDASQSSTVVDTFANAVNRSKLTVEKLRTSLNYVGPIAQDANVTFQELSAAMMTLANSGIRASTIGTSLRQVLSQLVDPSVKFKNAAAEAGIALQDLDPTTQSFSHVLANLRLVLKDTGTAFEIFGKRGASAALALTAQGSQYNDLLSTVTRTGTAAEMAAKQMEGLGVSFKNLQDKLSNLAIYMGKGGIALALRIFVDVAREAVDVITAFTETGIGRAIIQLGTLITVVGLATGIFIGLKSAIAGSALAIFISEVVLATKVTWAAVIATTSWTAALKANPAIFIFSGIALAAASLIAYITELVYKNKDLIQETAILANEYGTLIKKVKDYQISVVSLSEDSDELKNANLALRKELENLAKNNPKLVKSIKEITDAIDPLNGSFNDSKEVIHEFREELEKVQFETLKKASNEAAKSLRNDINTSLALYRQFSLWLMHVLDQTSDKIVQKLFKPLGLFSEFFADKVTAATERMEDRSKAYASTNHLEKALKKDTALLEDVNREILSWGDNLNKRQQRIKDYTDDIAENARAMLSHLRETGQVTDTMSVDVFEKIAKDLSLTNFELQVYLDLFAKMKDAQGPENIFEKWMEEPSSMNILTYIDEFIKEYEKFGGVISDVQMEEFRGIEKNRAAMVDSYKELVENMPDPSDSREVWDRWVAEVRALQNQATQENANFSKNQLGQLILAFNASKVELAASLQATEKQFEHSAETASKEIDKITNDHNRKLTDLFKGVAKEVGESSKKLAEEFKSNVGDMSSEFDRLEKEAEKAWKNIPKHAETSLEEQHNALGNWLSIVQDRMGSFSSDMSSELDKLNQALGIALQADEMDVFNGIKDNIETVTSEGIKYFEQMGGSIGNVLDHLADRESQLLDNLEKYAQQALNIQQKVSDIISDLDQKQMDNREKFEDNSRKAEEARRQAIVKTAEAEKLSGDERIKKLEEAEKAWEKYLSVGKNISSEIKNHDAIEKRILDSKQKIRDIESQIRSLSTVDDAKEIERLNKQKISEIEKQKTLQDKLSLSVKADTEYRRIAQEYEKGHLSVNEQLTVEKERQLKDTKDQIADTEQLLGIVQNIVITLRDAKLDIDPQEAIAKIQSVVTELGVLSKPIHIKTDFAKPNMKPIEDEIIQLFDGTWTTTLSQAQNKDMFDPTKEQIRKVGKTWTTTWTQAKTEADETAKEIARNIDAVFGEKIFTIKGKATLEGSTEKPITEKIAEIKEKFENLVSKLTEEIQVHVTLPTYSDVMTKLQSIIDRLAEIKDKEITITTNYKSSGDSEPEGKQTGGLLPGYGGGDKIPLLAEAGEWIIRKEAVKKFGSSFFASLNSLRLPRFNTGGYIANAIQNISPVKTDYFAGLQDFGKVVLDTGSMQIPAMVRTDVIGEITNHLTKLRRFSS